MNQMVFVIDDLKHAKLKYGRFFIQMLTSLMLISFALVFVLQMLAFKQKISNFGNGKDIYIIRDVTSAEEINSRLFENPDARKNLMELYSFIHELPETTVFSYYQQAVKLQNKQLESLAAFQSVSGDHYYARLFVDLDFIHSFSLNCESGQFFDFNSIEKDNCPVILGSNFKRYFQIGDRVYANHVVAGFLERQSFYLAPGETNEVLYLDDYVIEPLIMTSASEIADYDMAINHSTILTENEANLSAIKDQSSAFHLYDFEFISYSKQLEKIVDETVQYVLSLLSLALIILFFCVVCLVSSLLAFIDTHQREFSIHLLCGARRTDFIWRIVLQICTLIVIADLSVIAVQSRHPLAIVWTMGISIVMTLFIVILPIGYLTRQNIGGLLKRGE